MFSFNVMEKLRRVVRTTTETIFIGVSLPPLVERYGAARGCTREKLE